VLLPVGSCHLARKHWTSNLHFHGQLYSLTDRCNSVTPQVVDACSLKPGLTKRALISGSTAERLADVFEVLANDTRLRMLHALAIGGELSVSALADTVGMKTAAVSNQLQKLSLRSIVKSRRNGNTIYYRILDPCVLKLLDRGLCLTEDAAEGSLHESVRSALFTSVR
jgi:DNA-binding transcriptional ArsR family regulator